jgi:hypothetical protein
MQDLDLYCRNHGDKRNSIYLRAVRATQKTSLNIFLENKRKLYHVRYVHIYKESFGSFHSNQWSERYEKCCFTGTKGISFKKKLWTFFAGSILTIFKKEKLHRLWISLCNISTIGIDIFKIHLKFISNSVFPFITYPLLLIDLFEV